VGGLAIRTPPEAIEREVNSGGVGNPSRNTLRDGPAHSTNWVRHGFLTERQARTARKAEDEGYARLKETIMEGSNKCRVVSRRQLLGTAGLTTLTFSPLTALADAMIRLPLPGGPDERSITTAFPEKGPLILQRTRPPLLETPLEVFDQSVFTPNDRFYVRWHWSVIPTSVDVKSFRLAVHGHVSQSLSLSLDDLMTLPQMEIAAVNQCSGNSRGYFQPRVSGAQWSHGSMGNARWRGVSVR